MISTLSLLFACGTPATDHAHGPHDHADGAHDHDHGKTDHAHDEGTAPHPHDAGSDHMADMRKTRDALRTELGAAYDQPVPGLDTADVTKGEALYEQHCTSCHGASGKGDGPIGADLVPKPSDFTDAFHARFYSDAARVHIIEKGAAGTAMTPFGAVLDPAQRLEVYAFVRTLRQ